MSEEVDVLDNELAGGSTGKLPMFLKVLCILTFVGSGLAIFQAFFGLATSSETAKNLEALEGLNGGAFGMMGVNIDEMIRWTFYSQIANLIGALMTLGGALLMWGLRKTGFYLYVVGYIVPFVVSVAAMKYMLSGSFAGIGTIALVINGMIMAAFLIMYGVNFKHLK